MTFREFRKLVELSTEDICTDIFRGNAASIKIKKERVGVRNLVNIFNATLKLSLEKGFQAMSMRDLSRETGLSMGALYSYFSGKEELLEIIQNQGLLITYRVMQSQLENVKEPRERLRAAVRSHLYLSEVMHPWFYFAYMETRNFSREKQKKAIQGELHTEKLFEDILEQGRGEGSYRATNSQLTAALIKAMLQDWYLKRWKYSRRGVGVEQYADFVIEFVEAGIKNDVSGNMGGDHGSN